MLRKKGNKSDRTVMMENIILDFFLSNFKIELKPEYRVSTGIADFFGQIHNDYIILELKQSINDFYSGHGLNFVGTSNYMVVPSELVGFAITFLRKENLNYVGVIEITEKGTARIITYPSIYSDNEFIYKRFPSTMFEPYHLRGYENHF